MRHARPRLPHSSCNSFITEAQPLPPLPVADVDPSSRSFTVWRHPASVVLVAPGAPRERLTSCMTPLNAAPSAPCILHRQEAAALHRPLCGGSGCAAAVAVRAPQRRDFLGWGAGLRGAEHALGMRKPDRHQDAAPAGGLLRGRAGACGVG